MARTPLIVLYVVGGCAAAAIVFGVVALLGAPAAPLRPAAPPVPQPVRPIVAAPALLPPPPAAAPPAPPPDKTPLTGSPYAASNGKITIRLLGGEQ